jgi:2-polyprenyl-3-methyl-5-hydroxy-6-metoxy-1,4-benzoquinol methylase
MLHHRGQMTGRLSPFLETRRIRQAVPHICGRRRVLDVGCGRARLLAHLDRAATYVGIDLLADVIAEARVAYPQHDFRAGDIEDGALPLGEEPFDAIVLLAVIEHLSSPVSTLRRLASLLSPAGIVVITTPHPRAEPLHELGARLGLFSREASEEHTGLFDRGSLQDLASACELRITRSRRFQLGLNQLFLLARSAP